MVAGRNHWGGLSLIPEFFEYVRDALAEQLVHIDHSFSPPVGKRGQSVLWTKRVSSNLMPFRFVKLWGYHGREEFGINIGWSNEPTFPSSDFFEVLADRGLPMDSREPPDVPSQVPLISDFILGAAGDAFDTPNFEALPPSLDRLAEAVRCSFATSLGLERLRGMCEVSGVEDQLKFARTKAGARRVAVEIFNVRERPLPTDWQFVKLLTEIVPEDIEAAVSGPTALACMLLVERAFPLLQSDELRPAI